MPRGTTRRPFSLTTGPYVALALLQGDRTCCRAGPAGRTYGDLLACLLACLEEQRLLARAQQADCLYQVAPERRPHKPKHCGGEDRRRVPVSERLLVLCAWNPSGIQDCHRAAHAESQRLRRGERSGRPASLLRSLHRRGPPTRPPPPTRAAALEDG